MTDVAQYGIAGVAIALVGFLARIIWEQQAPRRPHHPEKPPDGIQRLHEILGSELKDIRENMQAVRSVVEALRDLLQAQVTKMAVLEYRVVELERRCSHLRNDPAA